MSDEEKKTFWQYVKAGDKMFNDEPLTWYLNTTEREQYALGKLKIEKQHSKGRLTARERISNLIDSDSTFFEIGIFAAFNMYLDLYSCISSSCVGSYFLGRNCNKQPSFNY